MRGLGVGVPENVLDDVVDGADLLRVAHVVSGGGIEDLALGVSGWVGRGVRGGRTLYACSWGPGWPQRNHWQWERHEHLRGPDVLGVSGAGGVVRVEGVGGVEADGGGQDTHNEGINIIEGEGEGGGGALVRRSDED